MSRHLSLCLGSGCSQGSKEALLLTPQSSTAGPSLWDVASSCLLVLSSQWEGDEGQVALAPVVHGDPARTGWGALGSGVPQEGSWSYEKVVFPLGHLAGLPCGAYPCWVTRERKSWVGTGPRPLQTHTVARGGRDILHLMVVASCGENGDFVS